MIVEVMGWILASSSKFGTRLMYFCTAAPFCLAPVMPVSSCSDIVDIRHQSKPESSSFFTICSFSTPPLGPSSKLMPLLLLMVVGGWQKCRSTCWLCHMRRSIILHHSKSLSLISLMFVTRVIVISNKALKSREAFCST